jgi:PST family polysaccharide transporter
LSQPAVQSFDPATTGAGAVSADVAAAAVAANADPANVATSAAVAVGRDNLARRTAHGFAWLIAQTIGSKLVGLASQFILAWVLTKDDFGLWGSVTIIIGFSGLIQQAGLRETLIRRQRTYHLWANPAFWMSAGLGLLAAALTAAAAHPVAVYFKEPRLVGLLLVLAATAPLMSLDTVAEARLQNQLRFQLLAWVNWGVAIGQLALQLLFAFMLDEKYRAYCFVLPRPFIALVRLTILWRAARPPVRLRPEIRRWRFLYRDSATLFVASVFLMIQWQGDYIVLKRLYPAAVLGIYFMAYNLSIQTMQLFTGNLTGVLFPALSKLQADPARQIRAFLDATRLLALIAVPLCMLQAAVAEPGVRLFFQDQKWQDVIPVLQALSVGMAFRVVASPGGSLIQAQGRFRVTLITNVINAVVFLSLVAAGALMAKGHEADPNVWVQPPTTVGIAVAVYFAVISPTFLYIAIRPSGGTWRDIGRVYWAPMLAGVLAAAGAMGMGALIPVQQIRGHHWGQSARLIVVAAWFVVLYVPLIRLIAPDAWRALLTRIVGLYRGRGNDGAGAP